MPAGLAVAKCAFCPALDQFLKILLLLPQRISHLAYVPSRRIMKANRKKVSNCPLANGSYAQFLPVYSPRSVRLNGARSAPSPHPDPMSELSVRLHECADRLPASLAIFAAHGCSTWRRPAPGDQSRLRMILAKESNSCGFAAIMRPDSSGSSPSRIPSTKPPASRTSRMPAATSHGWLPRSQYPS